MKIERFQVPVGSPQEAAIDPRDSQVVMGRAGSKRLVVEISTNKKKTRKQEEDFEFVKSGVLLEDFTNCGNSPTDVLRFTRDYGTLFPTRPGEEFRFNCESFKYEPDAPNPLVHAPETWIYHRNDVRERWEQVVASYAKPSRSWKFPNFVKLPESKILIDPKHGLILTLDSLLSMLHLSFAFLPWPYLRVCQAPDCKKRFFVADHLSQRYCGRTECIVWGDRKSRRSYYHAHKED